MKTLCVVLGLGLLAGGVAAAHADTVAGYSGSAGSVYLNNPEAVSWTQRSTYTNETIDAYLSSGFSNDGSGTVYLTDSIGPGTTSANILAQTTVSGVTFYPSTPLTLFSGLTLGPGTYYVVTDDSSGSDLGWETTDTPTDLATAGNSSGQFYIAFSGTDGAASDFIVNPPGYAALFEVTGSTVSATPEPGSLVLLGTGVLGFAGVMKRRLS